MNVIRYRCWPGIAFGIGASMLLAGPIFGALWGWATISRYAISGNTVGAAAHRLNAEIKVRHYLSVDYPFVQDRDGSDCEDSVESKLRPPQKGSQDWTDSNLKSAIVHWRSSLEETYRNMAFEYALAQLSTVTLGALDGCIHASLLAKACENYVMRVGSSGQYSRTLESNLRKAKADAGRIWCRIDRLL